MAKKRLSLFLAAILAATSLLTGCGSTGTSKGATTGAAVGALVGGWRGAATGALLGGGIGFASDYSKNTAAENEVREREVALAEAEALQKSSLTDDANTSYRPKPGNSLVGNTWRIVSFVSQDEGAPQFKSLVITFQTNTQATTLLMWEDGTVESYVETYQTLDNALVFSGSYNGEKYVTNTRYSISGGQMVLVSETIRAVLEEIEESV